MVGLGGEKMSKSLGNLIFVSKLISAGTDPMAIRWALMSHPFTDDLMWSQELLTTAEEEVAELRLQLSRVDVAPTDEVISSIIAALSKNIDTRTVQEILRGWVNATKSGITGGEAGELARALDTLLGLAL
jgi:L-cysteine:1D-myo-inositol 2-amino-2-deoxy-alpha-D-glucopyranoside ligase